MVFMELFWPSLCLLAIGLHITGSSPVDENADLVISVEKCRAGDRQAFNTLVRLFQGRTYTLAFNYLKDREEAKDVTQDIFVTVYRTIHTLQDSSKFAAWLYQLSLNHCRNRYRQLVRRGFYNTSSIDDPDSPIQLTTGETPEGILEQQDLRSVILEAMAGMSETENEILILRDIQGLSYETIGELLDVPLGTVKSRINRARSVLKDRLQRFL